MSAAFRAFQRLERSPEARLKWIVDATQELASSTMRWHEELALEAGFFAGRSMDSELVSQALKLRRARAYSLLRSIKTGLNLLAAGQQWTINIPPTSFTFVLRVVGQTRVRVSGFNAVLGTKDFETAFLYEVKEAVVLAGERLRICARPGCGRLFVKRKRALYCGLKCSRREKSRRYFSKLTKAERQKKRHARYIREVERADKNGPARAKHIKRRSGRKS